MPSASEQYAQNLLDYLYDEDCLEMVEGDVGLYKGSLHTLLRRVDPSAQAGIVINQVLVKYGAVNHVAQGVWQVNRRALLESDGQPVGRRVGYGHDSRTTVLEDNADQVARAVVEQGAQLGLLQTALIELNTDQTMILKALNEVREHLGLPGVRFASDEQATSQPGTQRTGQVISTETLRDLLMPEEDE